MNPKLPKPVHDALGRETGAGDHPSADLLTAFVESALLGNDKERITDHLSRCNECREVVFLTASLAQEETAAQDNVAPPETAIAARVTLTPRWRWKLAFAAPIAIVLIVGGVIVQQREESRSERQIVAKAESQNTTAPMPEPQSTTGFSLDKRLAAPPPTAHESAPVFADSIAPSVAKPARPDVRSKSEAVHRAPSADYGKAQMAPLPETAKKRFAAKNAPAAAPDQVAISNGSTTFASVAPTQSQDALAPTEPSHATAGKSTESRAYAAGALASPALALAAPQWRVTAEGYLEHFSQGHWTRELGNEATAFRVVSVVGNNVWAGGSSGGLFHSTDGGRNWSRVLLPASPASEPDAIVSIQFDDALHGLVLTASGTRFSTRNGGLDWKKE